MKTTYFILTAILGATLSFGCGKAELVQKRPSKLEETLVKEETPSELEKALANEKEVVTKCEKRGGKVFISYETKGCAEGYGAREIVTCLSGSNLGVNSFGFPCESIPENSEETWIGNCHEVSGKIVQRYEAEKHLYQDSSQNTQNCFRVNECISKWGWGPLTDFFEQVQCNFISTADTRVREIKHFPEYTYCPCFSGPI